MTNMKHYYLGLDGGGTKTEAVLCADDGSVCGYGRAGSGNPNDVGMEQAVRAAAEAFAQALSGLPDGGDLHGVFAGCAGTGACRDAYREAVSALFSERQETHVRTGTDAENLLSCGLLESDGCGLIAGTGSCCMVRQGGSIRMIGGWGYLLDDCGSGFAIGRDGVAASLRALDGRGEPTCLTQLLEMRLGKLPSAAIGEIYRGGKAFLASLAAAVFEAAEQGDHAAGEILRKNAAGLAECADAAVRCFPQMPAFCAGGGILEAHPRMLQMVEDSMHCRARIRLIPVKPVFGAIVEARRLDGSPTSEAERRRFAETFAAFAG